MEHLKIRRLSTNDLNKLQEFSGRTFSETFSSQNTKENMEAYLESSFSMDKLKLELYYKNSQFYFAELDTQVIGYLKINFGPPHIETDGQNSLEIERIYVIKEFHGKKVGQLLYNKAIEIAKKKKTDYVWLGVWEKNPKAIRFYKKNGFTKFSEHLFILGNERQTDVLMKLQLN